MPEKNFKKKNTFEKLSLKFSDRQAYLEYKRQRDEFARAEKLREFSDSKKGYTREIILDKIRQFGELNFLHSGNAGDIIYALPTLKAIAELGAGVNLLIKLNQSTRNHLPNHPLGAVMMNNKMAEMLQPLLKKQPYITACDIYEDQRIDIDLDLVRDMGVLLDRGNITRWYSFLTGINTRFDTAWLIAEPDKQYNDTLVVARSQRYRDLFIDYSFLSTYPNKVFVGVEAEWKEMQQMVPDIKWVQVSDFLELAGIIAGCKCFLGNQSFPFSIAEGLKVPRILETYIDVPNVIPEGPGGYDFYLQAHLESLVAHLMQ